MIRGLGGLLTVAGNALTAIGRMVEGRDFNDDAAADFLAGRMECDGPDASQLLAEAEAEYEVFEPVGVSFTDPCPGCSDFACPGPHITSAATPGPAAERPNPDNPPPGLGHLTSLGPVDGSQQLTGGETREAVGATEHESSGGGVDRPTSWLLYKAAHLCTGICIELNDTAFPAQLRDRAAQFTAIED